MIFIDANIFLRVLVRDDEKKSKACLDLFHKIDEGKIDAYTSDMTVGEVVWTLSSYYHLSPGQIKDNLLPLLTLKGLELPSKKIFPKILEVYSSLNIDFIDAYHAVLSEVMGIGEIVSYDRDFDRVKSIKRHEP